MKTKFLIFAMTMLLFACSQEERAPELDSIGQNTTRKLSSPKNNSVGTLVTEAADFSPRSFHTPLVFKDMVWVIGGSSFDGNKNDVWTIE